jgi:hypothetical protein
MPIKRKIIATAVLGALATLASSAMAEVDLTKLPPPATRQGVTYEKDIRPLFEASCARCHSGDKPKAGLGLDKLEAVLKGSKDGKVLTPGKSKESSLVIAISQLDPEMTMPPKPKAGRGGPGGPGGQGAPPPPAGAAPGNPGGQGGPGGPGGGPRGGGFGPPPKPLTAEQVGLVRAWIDQGAK